MGNVTYQIPSLAEWAEREVDEQQERVNSLKQLVRVAEQDLQEKLRRFHFIRESATIVVMPEPEIPTSWLA